MTTRADVVAEARTWLGTRWMHQGRMKGVGADCIGLIGGIARSLDLPGAPEWAADADLHAYGRTPVPEQLLAGCERFLDRIKITDAAPGDVLVMAFVRDPQHFAIVSRVDPMYLIHAYAQVRRVVENGAAVAGAKIVRAYRFRGLA